MLCRFEDKVPLTFIMYERFYKSNIKPWNQLLKRAQFTLSFNHKLSAKAVSIKFSWKYTWKHEYAISKKSSKQHRQQFIGEIKVQARQGLGAPPTHAQIQGGSENPDRLSN